VHKAITKIIKAFLWSGSNVVQSKKCLVAWDRVQRPTQLCCLGVLDLKRMGMALRLKWLWRSDTSQPWANLPIKEDRLTTAFFQASIRCEVGNGRSKRFWTDPWLQGHTVESMAPDLFTALLGRRWQRRTVADALSGNSWLVDIQGSLTIPVPIQYIQLRVLVDAIQLNPDAQDSTIWHWNSTGAYSTHSAYEAMFLGQSATCGAKELWKVCAPEKCRLFIWRLMHERVWMFERLQWHGVDNYSSCALCTQEVESMNHLFVGWLLHS
jgi:hypothetical protein